MKTRQMVILGVLLLLVGMIFILMNNKGKFELTKEGKKGNTLRYVKAVKISTDSSQVMVEGSGRISNSRKIDLSSEVQGMLIQGSVPLKPGTKFSAGQVLFSIRDVEARLALQARKSAFLNVMANALPDLRLDYSDNYTAWKNFFEQIETDKALPELPAFRSAKEKTFIASRNILSEYFGIKADEERLRKYSFVAPFSGSITEVMVEPGSIVNPGARIASIINSGELELDIPIDVQNLKWISNGGSVELSNSDGTQHFSGKIVRIGEYVNPTTQSIPVFVQIDKKPNQVLFNGMYLVARIKGDRIAQTFALPRRSIFNENKVYVVEDSLLKIQEVKIEFVTSREVIASGLKENSTVVTEPLTNVNDTVKVATILQ